MVKVISFFFDIAFACVSVIIQVVFELINSFFSSDKKTEYDADYMKGGEILSSRNHGFCLTGKKCLTIEDSFKNALIIGSTGAHKSSGILIPSILRMRGHSSLVINDPSCELAYKTSGALMALGYIIMVLNYGGIFSEGYNPLQRIKSISDIQKLSKILILNSLGTGGKDPFWNMAAESLLSLCIRYMIQHTSKEYHTPYNVYHLVSALAYAPDNIDRLFAATQDAALLAEYKAFLTYGDKMLSSIVATCRTALAIFGTDPMVAVNTSHDTIDFSLFRKKKVALYINTSVTDMRYYGIVTSLFLDQFFGEVMSSIPGKEELPIFFLIDEASSLYFNNLQLVCSNIRKGRAGILQIYQSAAQIQDLYSAPVARAITENSFAKVYMPGQSIEVAKELSTTLGSFEYRNEKDARVIRPLALPNEIREFSESIILCGNHRAIREEVIPYFKQSKLHELTKLAPYQPINKQPFDTPPKMEIL